ncbi:MAG: transglycosylase domain-containing protein [Limnochordia bacterium]|nr:transglycosylase domain-containing protein [Limnochordia bacterium]MDD2629311.1 transglycosylase domain-containing protein [Limnochordia bacterium]MDD4517587.1 transglycosylase domain-containing protein [Limnochordia bacterium]
MQNNRSKYALATIIVILLLLIVPTIIYMKDLSTIKRIQQEPKTEGIQIYDANGQLIAQTGSDAGSFVAIDKLPSHTKQAFQAAVTLQPPGKNTLTEQITQQFLVGPHVGVARALESKIGNLAVRNRLSEEEKLAILMNQGDFGKDIQGITDASLTYFNISPTKMDLAQSALLAAILGGPEEYSPYTHPVKAANRRNEILDKMNELGYITASESKKAKEISVEVVSPNATTTKNLAALVTQQLQNNRVPNAGLNVITSIDPNLQEAARQIWPKNLSGVLIAIDPASGLIRALISEGKQDKNPTLEEVQPGATFNPILYASAITQGFRLNTLVPFTPSPTGNITLKHSVVQTPQDLPQWILGKLNKEEFTKFTNSLGLGSIDATKAEELATGQGAIPLLNLIGAYIPFAGGGNLLQPTIVQKVSGIDNDQTVFEHKIQENEVITPQVAYLITDLLTAEFTKGVAAKLEFGGTAAGKGNVDNRIFIGYSPDLLVAVYLVEIPEESDPSASSLWKQFMDEIAAEDTDGFQRPASIVQGIEVDIYTGYLATVNCPAKENSAFIQGTQPTTPCYLHPAQAVSRLPVTPPPPSPTPTPTPTPEQETPKEEPEEPVEPEAPKEPVEPEEPSETEEGKGNTSPDVSGR